LAVFTAFNILANYKFPLNEALGVIATFFFIVKELANLSRAFVFSLGGFRVFRQALRHFR